MHTHAYCCIRKENKKTTNNLRLGLKLFLKYTKKPHTSTHRSSIVLAQHKFSESSNRSLSSRNFRTGAIGPLTMLRVDALRMRSIVRVGPTVSPHEKLTPRPTDRRDKSLPRFVARYFVSFLMSTLVKVGASSTVHVACLTSLTATAPRGHLSRGLSVTTRYRRSTHQPANHACKGWKSICFKSASCPLPQTIKQDPDESWNHRNCKLSKSTFVLSLSKRFIFVKYVSEKSRKKYELARHSNLFSGALRSRCGVPRCWYTGSSLAHDAHHTSSGPPVHSARWGVATPNTRCPCEHGLSTRV